MNSARRWTQAASQLHCDRHELNRFHMCLHELWHHAQLHCDRHELITSAISSMIFVISAQSKLVHSMTASRKLRCLIKLKPAVSKDVREETRGGLGSEPTHLQVNKKYAPSNEQEVEGIRQRAALSWIRHGFSNLAFFEEWRGGGRGRERGERVREGGREGGVVGWEREERGGREVVVGWVSEGGEERESEEHGQSYTERKKRRVK